MYLYLGQDTVVGTDDIVGIFDLENTSISRVTKAYLAGAQKSGHIVEVSPEIPKSFVVCEKKGRHRVYLIQISPATLKKRSAYIKDLANL